MTWTPSYRATGSEKKKMTNMLLSLQNTLHHDSPWSIFCMYYNKDTTCFQIMLCSFSFFFCSDLFQIGSFLVRIMAHVGMDLSSLKKILLVWTSSWKRPSNTVAPRGRQPPGAQRTMIMTRSAGRSEQWFPVLITPALKVNPYGKLLLVIFSGNSQMTIKKKCRMSCVLKTLLFFFFLQQMSIHRATNYITDLKLTL